MPRPFAAGWHHVSLAFEKGSSTWTGIFDGVIYPDLNFSHSATAAFDIGKVILINALREEVQMFIVDNFVIAE